MNQLAVVVIPTTEIVITATLIIIVIVVIAIIAFIITIAHSIVVIAIVTFNFRPFVVTDFIAYRRHRRRGYYLQRHI